MTAYARFLDRLPAPFVDAVDAAHRSVSRAAFDCEPMPSGVVDALHAGISKARAWGALRSARAVVAWMMRQPSRFADETLTADAFFSKPFDEAVAAFLRRYPDVGLSPDDLAELYDERGYTLAERAAAELEQTAREWVAYSLAHPDEVQLRDYRDLMQASYPAVRGYWETVYRTNVAQAYSDGQVAQARAVDGIVGFRRIATRDTTTRANHRAGHGQVVSKHDPRLDYYLGPWGFNCRCTTAPVTRTEAERRGLQFDSVGRLVTPEWPADARPDEGFKAAA